MAEFTEQLSASWPLATKILENVFTTQDYVDFLTTRSEAIWRAITDRYGPGGKGSGNFYSPANAAFNFLRAQAKAGTIFQRQFVGSRPGWGSHVVAQWERVGDESSIPPQEEDLAFVEGNLVLRQHLVRERAMGLRSRVLSHREKLGLACDCCGRKEPEFDIELQRAMFEVHHRRPLAEGTRKTEVRDVDLLCATCHRLIHRFIATTGRMVDAGELSRQLGLSRTT